MEQLRKLWFRLIAGFLGGGFLNELIHILTGDANRPQMHNFSLLYGFIIFIVLTAVVKVHDWKSPRRDQKKEGE